MKVYHPETELMRIYRGYPCLICLSDDIPSSLNKSLWWHGEKSLRCNRGHVFTLQYLHEHFEKRRREIKNWRKNMTKVSEMYKGSEYLSAKNITEDYLDTPLAISNAPVEEIGREDDVKERIVLVFEGKNKKLPLNSTNAHIMSEETGEDDSDDWKGYTIEITKIKTKFQGELVPALQISKVTSPKTSKKTKDRSCLATSLDSFLAENQQPIAI